jgi:Ala-tRNA(Pro) deacylase
MSIAATLERYLVENNIDYDLVLHARTASSQETAAAAHVAQDHIAKAVVIGDTEGYLVAVVPADNWLKLDTVRGELNRDLHLATEEEIAVLFEDCAVGAVPPIGAPYGFETLLDESLASLADVYFEAGDHEQLVRVRGEQFLALLAGARRGYFSHPG